METNDQVVAPESNHQPQQPQQVQQPDYQKLLSDYEALKGAHSGLKGFVDTKLKPQAQQLEQALEQERLRVAALETEYTSTKTTLEKELETERLARTQLQSKLEEQAKVDALRAKVDATGDPRLVQMFQKGLMKGVEKQTEEEQAAYLQEALSLFLETEKDTAKNVTRGTTPKPPPPAAPPASSMEQAMEALDLAERNYGYNSQQYREAFDALMRINK